jgi:hypothetical protein
LKVRVPVQITTNSRGRPLKSHQIIVERHGFRGDWNYTLRPTNTPQHPELDLRGHLPVGQCRPVRLTDPRYALVWIIT